MENNEKMIGQTYVHTNGGAYTIIAITNEHASVVNSLKYPVTVVYADHENKIWSRPLSTWDEDFTLMQ